MKVNINELKKAMMLISDLRSRQFRLNIKPIAMRVALKYLLLCDDHFAERKITSELDAEIDAYARYLFGRTKGERPDIYG